MRSSRTSRPDSLSSVRSAVRSAFSSRSRVESRPSPARLTPTRPRRSRRILLMSDFSRLSWTSRASRNFFFQREASMLSLSLWLIYGDSFAGNFQKLTALSAREEDASPARAWKKVCGDAPAISWSFFPCSRGNSRLPAFPAGSAQTRRSLPGISRSQSCWACCAPGIHASWLRPD